MAMYYDLGNRLSLASCRSSIIRNPLNFGWGSSGQPVASGGQPLRYRGSQRSYGRRLGVLQSFRRADQFEANSRLGMNSRDGTLAEGLREGLGTDRERDRFAANTSASGRILTPQQILINVMAAFLAVI